MSKIPRAIIFAASAIWLIATVILVSLEPASDMRAFVNYAFIATVLGCAIWHTFVTKEITATAMVYEKHAAKFLRPSIVEVTFIINDSKTKLELGFVMAETINIGDVVEIKYKGSRINSITRPQVEGE